MNGGSARQQCLKPGCERLSCFHLRFSDTMVESGPQLPAADTCGAHLACAVGSLVSWAERHDLPASGVRVMVYATASGRYADQGLPPSPLVDDAIDVVSIRVRRDPAHESSGILVDYSAAAGMCRSVRKHTRPETPA